MNPVPAFDVEEYQTARLIYITDAKMQKRICPTNSTQYTSTIADNRYLPFQNLQHYHPLRIYA